MKKTAIKATKKNIKQTNDKTQQKKSKKKMLKIELKSLYDINELINLPEFDYPLDLMYSRVLLFTRLFLKDGKLFIRSYNFKNYPSISENLKTFFTYYYNKFNSPEINEMINNKNNLYYNIIKYAIINNISYIKYIIEKEYNIINRNNTLFLVSDLISYSIKNKNLDLVLLKINETDDEISRYNSNKKIYPNLIDGQNIDKLNIFFNSLQKSNKKYDNICIENFKLNYDIFFRTHNFILKLPSIIYLIFNSIKNLNIGGNIHIEISTFNTNSIPIITKIFCILSNLFQNITIENLYNPIIEKILKLDEFKGFTNIYNEKLIDEIIILSEEHYNKILKVDDIISCLMSNKFYYKLDDDLINSLSPYKKPYTKILFDIPNLIFSSSDINQSYKIIKMINENTKKNLYLTNYFASKYVINPIYISDYFKILYLNNLELLNYYNIKIEIDYKTQLFYLYYDFIKNIGEPNNNILTIKHIKSLNINNICNYENTDNNLIFLENYIDKKIIFLLVNNFKIYYNLSLLLKYNNCNTIYDLSNNLNKKIMRHITGITTNNIKFEFISMLEILNIYKQIFKKNNTNALLINYNELNTEFLDAIKFYFSYQTVLIKLSGTLPNNNTTDNTINNNYCKNSKNEEQQNYKYNIRYLNDDLIKNTIKSLNYYKIMGYNLIIPSINTFICNDLEYYNHEILQLLYIVSSSCKHSNSITKHKIIIDNLHKINNYNQINLIIDIIYIYSTLYKSIKIHCPLNTNNDTTFYIIGLDYLDNINTDIINKFISILEHPNKKYSILNKNINKNIYSKIIEYVINILEKCNNWRYNSYKLYFCKNLKLINCSNIAQAIYFKFDDYYPIINNNYSK
jgi:hypothetical protein